MDSELSLSRPAAGISDASAAGQALITAANAAAQRTTLGLGGAAVLNVGTTAGTVAAGDDPKFFDARSPTAHATSHKSGGSDALKLDELAAPTDVATLDASSSTHGLLKKVGTGFLQDNGAGGQEWTKALRSELGLKSYTVSGLPASPATGAAAYCSDCLTPTGTGSLVFHDGTYWRTVCDGIIATTDVETYLRSCANCGTARSTAKDLIKFTDFLNSSDQTFYATSTNNAGTTGNGLVGAAGRFGAQYANTSGTAQFPIWYTQTELTLGTIGALFISGEFNFANLSDGTNTYNSRIGLQDGTNSNSLQANGIYFSYDTAGTQHTASANIRLIIRSGSTTYYDADSGVAAVGGSYMVFSIWVNAAANEVKFFLNGTQVGTTQTSNIPTASMRFVYNMSRSAGTASRYIYNDWIRMHIRRSLANGMGGLG